MMKKARPKRRPVFSLAEVARARKALMAERLGVLPVAVDEFGYRYDPLEAIEALRRNPPECSF